MSTYNTPLQKEEALLIFLRREIWDWNWAGEMVKSFFSPERISFYSGDPILNTLFDILSTILERREKGQRRRLKNKDLLDKFHEYQRSVDREAALDIADIDEELRKLILVEQAREIFSELCDYLDLEGGYHRDASSRFRDLPYLRMPSPPKREQNNAVLLTLSTAYILQWIMIESISVSTSPNRTFGIEEGSEETLKEQLNRFIRLVEHQSELLVLEGDEFHHRVPSKTNQQLLEGKKDENEIQSRPDFLKPLSDSMGQFPYISPRSLEQHMWEFLEGAVAVLDIKIDFATLARPIKEMGKVEGRVEVGAAPLILAAPSLEPTSPSVQLWYVIELANARAIEQRKPLLNEQRLNVLRTYLTRQVSMEELTSLAGVTTKQGVHDQLRKSMKKVFPYLPEDIRAQYETPKKALRVRSGKPTEQSLSRMKDALDSLKQPETGKREFSPTHRRHLTAANERRWQRYREASETAQPSDQP